MMFEHLLWMFKHRSEQTMEPRTQPVLFVSHGAPTLALDEGAWGAALKTWAGTLDAPKGILVLSAHWEQPGPVRLMSAPHPATLHDFGGFPDALYQMRYPAPGDPALAARAAELLRAGGVPAELDATRPIDHGAWVPLRAAFPQADIPVVQVSLPAERTPRSVYRMGQLLSPLRQDGILLIASGGVVHNLRRLDWSGHAEPEPWARAFEQWVAARVAGGEADRLLDGAVQAEGYPLSVPTPEHFDPLYFALGAGAAEPAHALFDGWSHGNLSLRTWTWAA
jgi:4,5-DOPA dioxygenase extradiol